MNDEFLDLLRWTNKKNQVNMNLKSLEEQRKNKLVTDYYINKQKSSSSWDWLGDLLGNWIFGDNSRQPNVAADDTAQIENAQAPTETITEEVSTPDYKGLWDLSTEIIRGNYGNGKARQQALEAEGYNYHQVQDFVNKRIWGTLTDEDYNRTYTNPTGGSSSAPKTPNTGAGPVDEDEFLINIRGLAD